MQLSNISDFLRGEDMKKALSILACLPLLFCCSCAPDNDSDKSEGLTQARMAKIAFNNKFLDFNRYVYPDCYAGTHYSDDGEKLIINVTSKDTGDFDFLLSEFECVELNLVKYSYRELYELAESINGDLKKDFSEIKFAQAKVDLDRNCLIIELLQETLDEDSVMSDLRVYFDGLPVVFEPPRLAPLL